MCVCVCVCVYISHISIYMMGYYSAQKKNELMPFAATWIDLEVIMLSEVSQKEMQIPYDITDMWSLKHDTNQLKQKQTHRHRKQTCVCQGEEGLGEGWTGSPGLAEAN